MKKTPKPIIKVGLNHDDLVVGGSYNVTPRHDEPKKPQGPWDPVIQKHIKELIAEINVGHEPFINEDIVTEIIVTALKAVQAQISRGDLKILSRTVRELRYAFKIFKDYRNIRKITLFGSARTKTIMPDYKLARDFSKKLAANGFMVITGAGPGIMKAGNEGAGPRKSFGVNIRLPFEQLPNKFIADQPTYIDCRYFFTRKLVFVKEASGAVFLPGGFGTLDEAFEILTLVQTGKSDPIPVIFLEPKQSGYWEDLAKFLRKNLVRTGKVSPEDLTIFKICHTADEACREIFTFYSNFHSLRYVGEDLVMRLQEEPKESTLAHLNAHFKDILVKGEFKKTGALPPELNQPDLAHLPRIMFKFNRINNGRLRQMIDYLNSTVKKIDFR